MESLKVMLVKFRPDPRQPRHGPVGKVAYQSKIMGANGEVKWLDYSHETKYYVQRTADYWAGLLGLEVEEVDNTKGWGKGT